mmetsp:Transcript_7173/g.32381  ORF Transcript_7173/g.32381 Transcript_7173/m.32381 type:complete len:293 (+) Transcript_7173:1781-2659(+)
MYSACRSSWLIPSLTTECTSTNVSSGTACLLFSTPFCTDARHASICRFSAGTCAVCSLLVTGDRSVGSALGHGAFAARMARTSCERHRLASWYAPRMASTVLSSAARPKRSASRRGTISSSAFSTSTGSAPCTHASTKENSVAPSTCVMNPRSSRLDSSATTWGSVLHPRPLAATASAVLALSRTPCARDRRQLAILPSTRPMSKLRSCSGRSLSRDTTAADAAGRTVPPLPSLSSTTVSFSRWGRISARSVATTAGWIDLPTTFVATTSESVSVSVSNSWKLSRTVAAARM